MDIFFLLKIDD